jgi:hypothetical protein
LPPAMASQEQNVWRNPCQVRRGILAFGDRWLEPGASVEPLQLAIDDVLPLLPWEDAASPSVISVGVR